jgi:hypothetical protein
MSKNLVLSRYRDPWTEWGEVHQKRAEWASNYFANMGRRTHLRGFHYWLVSNENITKPDGEPYLNSEQDWSYLQQACLEARYMGIGNWLNLTDRKHPEPLDYTEKPEMFIGGPGELYKQGCNVQDFINNKLSEFANTIIEDLVFEAPSYGAEGYQPYHLIVYCEKNTMNAYIDPICSEYKGVFQPLIGECSLERVLDHVRRAYILKKPVRIFYISDFDPSGAQMPVSVSRKFEYFAKEVCHFPFDIKLRHIALNFNQVVEYHLPGIPTKDKDTRAAAFVAKYGDRATELDALEALHPGVLGNMVRDALQPYYNAASVEAINTENEAITRRVYQLLEPLKDKLQQTLTGIQVEGLDGLHLNQALNPDFVPDDPNSFYVDDSTQEWLLDTCRDYEQQLEAYRRWKVTP